MSKIIFFDIDGTLLDHEKKIPSSTKFAIEQLKKNGIFVAIATGRAPFMFDWIRQELDIDSYVSLNGQYVVFENQVIYKQPLNQQLLHQLNKDSGERGHALVYLTHQTMKASHEKNKMIHESLDTLHFPYPDVEPEYYLNHEIYQSLLFCEEKDESYYRKNYDRFEFIRWHRYSLDVLPKGGSKALGIKKMIEKLNIPMEEVIAFGDGLNDVEMLQTVGYGVAMGNGCEQAKHVSELVTKDVSEEGIYHALKTLSLI